MSTKDVAKNCKSHVMPSAAKFKSKASAVAGDDSDTGSREIGQVLGQDDRQENEITAFLVTGLSSLHSSTSSDEGNTVVNNSGVTGIAEDGDFGTLV